jgi:hypothetical protein
MTSPKHILSGIAIILSVAGMIWPNNILVAAGVLLLGVCNFLP